VQADPVGDAAGRDLGFEGGPEAALTDELEAKPGIAPGQPPE
jgi:hypothetical protein